MKIDIKVEGVPEFLRKMRLVDDTVRKQIKVSLNQSGYIVMNKAVDILKNIEWQTRSARGYRRKEGKGYVHYPTGATIKGHWITGNLARSLNVSLEEKGKNVIDVIIGSDSPYAPPIESLPDGGFLTPALKDKGEEALAHARNGIENAIRGVASS